MQIRHFFDPTTSTLTYVLADMTTREAVVIDPVLDYQPNSGRTSTASAERVAAYLETHRLRAAYVVDTHAHADHLTALPFFRARFGARTVTGARIGEVQRRFRDLFNLGPDFPVAGEQFDLLLDEGDALAVGSLRLAAMYTPGHTPAHMAWRVGNVVFVGDTLFMPDYGTARCDFPGGSAEELYDSIQRLYALPDDTRLLMGHDYRPNDRPMRFETTVGEQKHHNVQLNARTTRAEFVAFRHARDAQLAAPVLLLPSVQVNIRAGALPEPESNGIRYLKIPLDRV